MNPSQLQHSTTVLAELLSFKHPADAVVSGYFRQHPKLGRQDRHEIAETAFAALRHLEKIQAFLNGQARKQPRLSALCALVLGRDASVGSLKTLLTEEETAQLSRLKGEKERFSSHLNTAAELPNWLIEILQNDHDDDTIRQLGRAMSQAAPLDLRVNTQKAKRDKVLAQLQAEGLAASATPYSPWGIRLSEKIALNKHPLFLDGSVEVQDEGSQLLALITGARRGEMVVDFCAGAGGKTLALGAMMANSGRLYAWDIAEKRLANLKPRLARAGLSNIHPERIAHEHDARIKRLAGKADRVLVDAPCSGLGTLRRNPDLKYRQSLASIAQLQQQQYSILQAAANLVKPGGTLVYATCSLLAAENQQPVERFLAQQPLFRLADCHALLAGYKIDLDTGTYLNLNPATHQTDGFFAAVLVRQ